MLLTANPRIIAFENHWAKYQRRFDFFKPYRTLSKKEITGNATMNLGLTI
jgi:hydroxymethylglutaryl-CoA synthase